MESKEYIIIVSVLVIIILYFYLDSMKEHMTTSDLEGVRNVSSLYNNSNMQVTKLTTNEVVGINNALKITGNTTTSGTITVPTINSTTINGTTINATTSISSPTITDIINRLSALENKSFGIVAYDASNLVNSYNGVTDAGFTANKWTIVNSSILGTPANVIPLLNFTGVGFTSPDGFQLQYTGKNTKYFRVSATYTFGYDDHASIGLMKNEVFIKGSANSYRGVGYYTEVDVTDCIVQLKTGDYLNIGVYPIGNTRAQFITYRLSATEI